MHLGKCLTLPEHQHTSNDEHDQEAYAEDYHWTVELPRSLVTHLKPKGLLCLLLLIEAVDDAKGNKAQGDADKYSWKSIPIPTTAA